MQLGQYWYELEANLRLLLSLQLLHARIMDTNELQKQKLQLGNIWIEPGRKTVRKRDVFYAFLPLERG